MPLFELEPWQIAVLLAPALLNTWGIWHVFKHTFATQSERMLWVVVCVLIPILGGFVYLLFGYRRATGKAGPLFLSPNKLAEADNAGKPDKLDTLDNSDNVNTLPDATANTKNDKQ